MEVYNTQKEHIVLKEYGRNVQMIANYIKTVQDKEERSRLSYALIDLMKQINPKAKESEDSNQYLWDSLHIITNFELDIDAPFPTPDKQVLNSRPKRVPYSNNNISLKTYGKNLEALIQKACEVENDEEREQATIYIGRLMKTFYYTWNRDNPEDHIIVEQLKRLSGGKLTLDLEKVRKDELLNVNYKAIANSSAGGGTRNSSANNRNKGKRQNNNNNNNRHKGRNQNSRSGGSQGGYQRRRK